MTTRTNHLTPADVQSTPSALAALDAAHRERMDACECPSCSPPRIGDLLPDVLAEMRRREARR